MLDHELHQSQLKKTLNKILDKQTLSGGDITVYRFILWANRQFYPDLVSEYGRLLDVKLGIYKIEDDVT